MRCEHTWKSPHARKAIHVGWFSCVLVFHSFQYPWRKMGTTRSLQKRSMSGGSIGTVGLCPVFRVGGRKINFRCDLKSLNSWVLFLSSWLVKTHKIARVLRKREKGGGGGAGIHEHTISLRLLLLKMTISSYWSKKWFFSTFHSHTQKAPVMITGFVEDHGDVEENPLLLCSKFF